MQEDLSPAPEIEKELERHMREESAQKKPQDKKKKKVKEIKEKEEGEGSSTQGSTHKSEKKPTKKEKKAKVVWLEAGGKEGSEKAPINPKTTQIVINLNKNQIEESEKTSKKKSKS